MRMATTVVVIGAALAAVAASGAAAGAVAAETGSQIKVCAHRDNGALRLPTGVRCRRSERTLRMALVGPAGAAGAAGAEGATGPIGPVGVPGPAGPTGPAGSFVGTAGGDLAGTYPDPVIGPNKVTSGKILDGTIITADLSPLLVAAGGDLTGSYPNPTLAAKSVAAAQLDVLPIAVARSSTLPYVDTEVFENVTMNAEDLDTTGTMHNTVTNNHQLVAPLRGIYAITIQVAWNGGNFAAAGYRAIRTEPAAIASTQAMIQSNSGRDVQSASGVMALDAGATVGLMAATTSPSFVTGVMTMRYVSAQCAVGVTVCAPVG